MELHPTPESWRVALGTAFGAAVVAAAGIWAAIVFAGTSLLLAGGILVALAGIATLLPAIGALSAVVDADANGVTIRRFGRESRYDWDIVADLRLVVRRANVPDGTEYHWVVPNRRTHFVAVPGLVLADGRVREIPALAGPSEGARRSAATEHLAVLARVRALQGGRDEDQRADGTRASLRLQTKATSASANA
jgi:hypothetical protein